MAGMASLSTAAAYGDEKLVEQIIKDAEVLRDNECVNKCSKEGMRPLCIAAFWGYEKIVQLLLANGADIDLCNRGTEWSPLHCATLQGHLGVVACLLRYCPVLTQPDSSGRTPVDFASASDQMWELFEKQGVKRSSKQRLIDLKVVQKVQQGKDNPKDVNAGVESGHLAHFSRPGSAYVMDRSATSRTGRQRTVSTEKQVGSFGNGSQGSLNKDMNKLVIDPELSKPLEKKAGRRSSQGEYRQGGAFAAGAASGAEASTSSRRRPFVAYS